MQAYKANIPIYAESDVEIRAFEQIFYDFVNEKREQGVAVTAAKLTEALRKFKNNPFLINYLKQ